MTPPSLSRESEGGLTMASTQLAWVCLTKRFVNMGHSGWEALSSLPTCHTPFVLSPVETRGPTRHGFASPTMRVVGI
nr:hypothetical protein [Tolivirales sp.]